MLQCYIVVVSVSGDGFYIAVGGGIGQHGWCHIRNILQEKKFNVQFKDHSEEMGLLSVQGPKRLVFILTIFIVIG